MNYSYRKQNWLTKYFFNSDKNVKNLIFQGHSKCMSAKWYGNWKLHDYYSVSGEKNQLTTDQAVVVLHLKKQRDIGFKNAISI